MQAHKISLLVLLLQVALHIAGIPRAPSTKHLLIECESVNDWNMLGTQLDLTPSQLNNIHVTYHAYGVDRQKQEMFKVWLKSSPNASWTDLITALRNMDENRVANEIEKKVYSPIPGTHPS